MSHPPKLISGLSAIAQEYDALICDIWGVLHNGREAYFDAANALRRFRRARGPVILLTNAPRPSADIERIFEKIGVPLDCFDEIVTSGIAAREELARRASGNALAMLHLGPPRDSGVYEGLNVYPAAADKAEIVLLTGPYDDEIETPENYRALFEDLKVKGLVMLCANPDIVVQRGDKLIYCAGALARLYQEMGGEVVYFGKPHRPVYDTALAAAKRIAGRAIANPLAIGDGADTDIKGANLAGIDALFVAQGIHASQIDGFTAEGLAQFFAVPGVHAKAALPTLVW
jgi:HAD superfamily hydrolase (TIGR01459 family)